MALTLDSLKPIHPKYDCMRTDNPKEVCSTYLNDKNPFNVPPSKEIQHPDTALDVQEEVLKRRLDWRARGRGLYYHYTLGEPKLVTSPVTDECQSKPPLKCRARTRTRCTQTRYRESSAQTRSYQPPVCGDKENYQHFEVYEIAQLIDTITPPGEYEAKLVERYRRRQQFKKALALVPDDKIKQRAILEAMAWEEWIAREEDIQNCQALRMKVVMKLFKKREEKMHQDSDLRILEGTERIQARRLLQLKKVNVQYARDMRRLDGEHQKLERRYRKGNIISDHCDPTSDLHAPQMRFGTNPNRRHFVGFKKHFDERIEELEKKIEDKGPGEFVCPFAKLRNWAKPKQRKMEVTQRFCSDENLKNLYESLKGLRMRAEAPKPVPLCLRRKTKVERRRQSGLSTITGVESDLGKLHQSSRIEIVRTDDVKSEEISKEELLRNLALRRSKDAIVKNGISLNGTIAEFEGVNLGRLLQFLNDELVRLKQLKKFQAIHLLAERIRWRREAHESGQRQQENESRKKYEELYDVCAQVHKDTACIFLESVLEEEFEYTADQLASQQILDLAKTIDFSHITGIMLADKERKWFFRRNLCDYIRTHLCAVAEQVLLKQRAEQLQEHEFKVLEEELYAAVKKVLEDEYKTPESVSYVGEILDDIIDNAVTYDFGTFTPDTSDDEFHTDREIHEIINKLIRVVIRYPGRLECFTDSSEYIRRLEAEREAKAILRKLIRRIIPEQRWNHSERIVEATVSETFDNVVYEVECLRASHLVKADDRLNEVLKAIFQRNETKKAERKRRPSESSNDNDSILPPLHSVPSNYDIFDNLSPSSESNQSDATGGAATDPSAGTLSMNRIDYVDPRMIDLCEPPLIGRRHERFDIMGRVAIRWREDGDDTSLKINDEEESSQDTSVSQFTRVSYDAQLAMIDASRLFLTPWTPSVYPDLAMDSLNTGRRLSRSYEKPQVESNTDDDGQDQRRRSF